MNYAFVIDLASLNLLAEFASESENEGALEVVRVQSLSLVGTAYSPLIYDLKNDTTYDVLISYLKTVNQNRIKNPNLPDKIVRAFWILFVFDKTASIYDFLLWNIRMLSPKKRPGLKTSRTRKATQKQTRSNRRAESIKRAFLISGSSQTRSTSPLEHM